MQNIPIYEALAQVFAAEGVDTHFTLMGMATLMTKVIAPVG